MRKFPEKTLHINANDKNKCLGAVGVHEMQCKLNLIDPEIFPLLNDDSIPQIRLQIPTEDLDIFEIVQKRVAGTLPSTL